MDLLLAITLFSSIAAVQPGEANRQPSLASAPGVTALVFGSGHSIYFSNSHDQGRTFSNPVRLAQVAALSLGRHRGPRVAISGDAVVVSAIYGAGFATAPHAHGAPANGDLVSWRSTDDGRSWSQPLTINDVPGSAREGLHAMAAGSNGELAAVWLDLRGHGTRLYGAFSQDSGATWSKNQLLYESTEGTICQCCDPSLTFSGPHQAQVMFRNLVQGNRDMYLMDWRLGEETAKPQKLGTGSWKLDACPMDGGGLAHLGNKTVSAWRREQTVYLDQPGQPEISLGQGKDVALSLSPKGPYVAWTSGRGIELFKPGDKQPHCVSEKGAFASMTSLNQGTVLLAWEQDGAIHFKVIE